MRVEGANTARKRVREFHKNGKRANSAPAVVTHDKMNKKITITNGNEASGSKQGTKVRGGSKGGVPQERQEERTTMNDNEHITNDNERTTATTRNTVRGREVRARQGRGKDGKTSPVAKTSSKKCSGPKRDIGKLDKINLGYFGTGNSGAKQ